MTKLELIQTLSDSRAEWEQVLEEVGEERMLEPTLHGGWSVKDTIGHVAYYECWLVGWLGEAVRGKVSVASHKDQLDADERNVLVREENAHRPLKEILEDSHLVYDRLLQIVKLLPEDDLFAPHRFDRYVVPFWGESRPLWRCLAGDSFEHYREHAENIRRWLDAQKTLMHEAGLR